MIGCTIPATGRFFCRNGQIRLNTRRFSQASSAEGGIYAYMEQKYYLTGLTVLNNFIRTIAAVFGGGVHRTQRWEKNLPAAVMDRANQPHCAARLRLALEYRALMREIVRIVVQSHDTTIRNVSQKNTRNALIKKRYGY
jgi:hypothetical protein